MNIEQMIEHPKFWISLAFIALMVMLYRKAGGFVTSGLDKRSARIKEELDTARKLREEAEEILANYKEKQARYEQEAKTILDDARKDADAFVKKAEADARKSLDERMNQAMQRIAIEEDKAINEVRSHVVDVAMAAARDLIQQQMADLPKDEVLKIMLEDIERKIH